MKKEKWIPAAVIFVLLIILACVQAVRTNEKTVDQIYTVSYAGSGNSLVTWYEDEKIVIAMADNQGNIIRTVSMPQKEKNITYRIQSACAGEDGRVYVLRDACDELSLEVVSEDLLIYDFNQYFPSKTAIDTENLSAQEEETDSEEWHYRWMNISGNVLSVIGVSKDQSKAVRRVLEFGEVTDKSLNIKSERYYPLAEDEDIYQAAGNGTDIAYISKSGKVFHATQDKAEEIYPAREVEVLMYPLYISFAESGYVFMQDGESGNILKLNIQNGEESVLMKGTEGFAATALTPQNIRLMSMASLSDFTAVVSENAGTGYQLLVMKEGTGYVIDAFRWPTEQVVLRALFYLVLELTAAGILIGLIFGIYRGITRGRTIMGKLLLAALPLMILTMSVFGVVAYQYYHDSVDASYEKQAVDEGNMMTALFGQESFDALEYPYDYSSDNYNYLKEQMDGRKLYSRVVYFEDGELYTGVDQEMPCFYPIGIGVNTTLDQLYLKAALTGEAVSATIEDRAGKRIVSVTPVGGSAGRSVYLYETGIFTAEMDAYQSSYIKNFIWICAAFLIVLVVLLTALFMKILQPLGEIREGMELFTGGNRDIRIEPETRDELAGISRVFNKMADDIDLQILNLKNLSDIYYRFMPMSMISLLKEDNLGNLKPGSCIKGNYAVLSVQLRSSAQNDSFANRAREMNRFFNMINNEAQKQNAVPIVDSANLSSMLLVCPGGAASAIRTALAILAGVDAYNAGAAEQERLNIVFLLHRSDIYVGICGDEKRYITALITPELENILTQREVFLNLSARLYVTEEAFRELSSEDEFSVRYVGNLGIEQLNGGFYECFDDQDAQAMHQIKMTHSNFRKAIKLYEEGYLYEAKTLFAMVLQDNPDDQIARYYIFRCG
ncbi:MAG: HAMP domain-containing protein [Lachnospiraceae bacterium]|nr:HAMP domain-containing protein [Lachnospiraceae bacterium]